MSAEWVPFQRGPRETGAGSTESVSRPPGGGTRPPSALIRTGYGSPSTTRAGAAPRTTRRGRASCTQATAARASPSRPTPGTSSEGESKPAPASSSVTPSSAAVGAPAIAR